MRSKHCGALLIFVAMAALVGRSGAAQEGAPPCSTPEYRQFDFWLGTWDLTWADSGRGTNVVTLELDSCVIEENFTTAGKGPFVGRSLSTYNMAMGRWQQTWVDNSGGYLDFTGGMSGDSMVLAREAVRNDTTFQQRMVFYNIAADSLDWSWQSSHDDGASWRTLWQIHYTRRR